MHTCKTCGKHFSTTQSLSQHERSKHSQPTVKRSTIRARPILLIISLLVVIGLVGVLGYRSAAAPGDYDTFANCLRESGTLFYGAFWCPHCDDQLRLFGNSANRVPYVECSTPDRRGQLARCSAAGIESYPTWVFGDGTRLSGVQSLEILAQRSGCDLIRDSDLIE